MIRALCIAALSLLFLPGCASVDKPVTTAANGGGPGTYYCWKERLTTSGDNMVCNWQPTFFEACESQYETPLAKSAVAAAPERAGRCDNGQWLVKVTRK